MTKRKPNVLLIVSTIIALTVLVAGLVGWLTTLYFNQQYANEHEGCQPSSVNHKVVIQNDKMSPVNTIGSHCDTLTITNLDDEQRLIAFGQHSKHIHYDGVEEKFLAKGQSLTVTLVQTGTFLFHDHEHDEVQGTVTVN
jgi:hypothetical protein